MKNFIRFSLLISLPFLASCGSDEPSGPTPVPSFTQDRMVIEVGEIVTFTNSSTQAVTYNWNFGDGSSSTDENPNHTFTELGSYDVVLTAVGSGGISVNSTATVLVGQRYSTSFQITAINFEKPDMEPWDEDSTGPELLFGFAESSETSITLFNLGEDVIETELPLGGNIAPDSQQLLTNSNWDFIFVDNDDPLSELGNEDEIMVIITVNPTEEGEKDYTTGMGSFSLSEFGFEVTIGFEVR